MMELESVIQVTQRYLANKPYISTIASNHLINNNSRSETAASTTSTGGGGSVSPDINDTNCNIEDDDRDVNSRKIFERISCSRLIPPLSLNIFKIATHTWNNCQFIDSPEKAEYQVSNVPMAHYGVKDILIIGSCPVPRKTILFPDSNVDLIRDRTRTVLSKLVNEHKVTAFMSLMAECDENGNEESLFRPYSKLDLPVIAPTAKFYKLGIKDCGVTDDSAVLGFAKLAIRLLESGEIVYLHCWGGHGRAGTVYCLILHLLYGMSAQDALNFCQCVHDCRESFINVGSPQTLSQATQVRRIIQGLATEPEL